MAKMYLVCAIISMIIFLWIYFTDVKKSIGQHIMVLLMAISDMGYFGISVAKTMEEAILANKIKYLSGCFLPMIYLFTICEVCHINLKKRIKIPLIILQIVLYGLVFTIGFSDIYYTNVSFYIQNGVGYLTKDYGPAHILYPITLYSYFSITIIISIYSGFRKKVVNLSELGIMAIFAFLAALSYLIPRMLHIETDVTAITTLIFLLGDLIPLYRSNLFTVSENKNIISKQLDKVGYVAFNRNLKFMSCNDYAAALFPELLETKVGRKINSDNLQLKQIISDVEKYETRYAKEGNSSDDHVKLDPVHINDKSFETELHVIKDFLNRCVGYAIELVDDTEHHKIIKLTTKYNEELSKEVDSKTERIRTIQEKTILGIAQMVESRDLSTGGHVKRTSDVVRIFSKKLLESDMGFSQDYLNLLIRSAPMHDLGKIGVDDAILRKNGKFTDAEYEQMKKHAEIGGKMVEDVLTGVEEDVFVQVAHNVANYHHERVNGEGYPEKLVGNNIPVEARIMALADVFDALVSKRCYKEAYSYDQAFSIIEEGSGTHFDSELTKVFLNCRPELEEYYNACKE